MGTQKITMGRGKDTDYESKKRSAMAQADSMNSYMWGMQSAFETGIGAASKASRSPQYGNTNLLTGDVLDGRDGNFRPRVDDAGNIIMEDPQNQTGFLDGQVSSTILPQTDPQYMNQDAMTRIALTQNGGQYMGLNNRQQVYGA